MALICVYTSAEQPENLSSPISTPGDAFISGDTWQLALRMAEAHRRRTGSDEIHIYYSTNNPEVGFSEGACALVTVLPPDYPLTAYIRTGQLAPNNNIAAIIDIKPVIGYSFSRKALEDLFRTLSDEEPFSHYTGRKLLLLNLAIDNYGLIQLALDVSAQFKGQEFPAPTEPQIQAVFWRVHNTTDVYAVEITFHDTFELFSRVFHTIHRRTQILNGANLISMTDRLGIKIPLDNIPLSVLIKPHDTFFAQAYTNALTYGAATIIVPILLPSKYIYI